MHSGEDRCFLPSHMYPLTPKVTSDTQDHCVCQGHSCRLPVTQPAQGCTALLLNGQLPSSGFAALPELSLPCCPAGPERQGGLNWASAFALTGAGSMKDPGPSFQICVLTIPLRMKVAIKLREVSQILSVEHSDRVLKLGNVSKAARTNSGPLKGQK